MNITTDLIGSIVEIPKEVDQKGVPSQERTLAVVRAFYLQNDHWPRFIAQTIAHLAGKGQRGEALSAYGGYLIERAVRDCKLCSATTVSEFLKLPDPPPAAPAAAKRGGAK